MSKRLLLVITALCVLGLGVLLSRTVSDVQATGGSSCGTVFYEKSFDYDDSRVHIEYEEDESWSSNYKRTISVSGDSGWVVRNVWLEVDDDNHYGYFLYSTGPLSSFNPNPGKKIDKAKVELKKACPSSTPVPSSTPTPTATPTPTTDVCVNIVGDQNELPEGMESSDGQCFCKEGYHRVDQIVARAMIQEDDSIQESFTCEPDEKTEATPTPAPSNPPSTEQARMSNSWNETTCENKLNVRMSIYENNKGIEGVTVFFKYKEESKSIKTNSAGEANVQYDFRGEDKVSMSAEGWSGQEAIAKPAENCAVAAVGGGQVLGATTMAGTGMFTDSLMNVLGLSGSLITMLGVKLYGKKNK